MRERKYSEEEDQTTRAGNLAKKDLSCLGCGRPLKNTDRCHRFCRSCNRRIARGVGKYYEAMPKSTPPSHKSPHKEREDDSPRSSWNTLYDSSTDLRRLLDELECRELEIYDSE